MLAALVFLFLLSITVARAQTVYTPNCPDVYNKKTASPEGPAVKLSF